MVASIWEDARRDTILFNEIYRCKFDGLGIGRVERDRDFAANLGFYHSDLIVVPVRAPGKIIERVTVQIVRYHAVQTAPELESAAFCRTRTVAASV